MHRTEGANNLAGQFTGGPPGTCLTPEWLNAVQEEICGVVEGAGLTVQTAGGDTKNQLLQACNLLYAPGNVNQWDAVIKTQADLNTVIERIGANHYHIKDTYKSILIRNTGITYEFPLLGGDTWGMLQTNLCTHLKMESGAYFSIYNVPNYIEVNTPDCKLENVWLKGNDVQGSFSYGFVLASYNVVFDNCKVSNISTNNNTTIFSGSGTASHNYSSKYMNCHVFDCTSNGAIYLRAFHGAYNLSNCVCYNIIRVDSAASPVVTGFSSCVLLSNCSANNFSNSGVNSGTFYGFLACNQLSNCRSYNFSCVNSGEVSGFMMCNYLSSCAAESIVGNTVPTAGFNNCSVLSSCYASGITGAAASKHGFISCSYGSASYTTQATNDVNDYFCSLDGNIAHQESTPQVFT